MKTKFTIGDMVRDLANSHSSKDWRGIGIVSGHDDDGDPVVFFPKMNDRHGCYDWEIKIISRIA